MILKSIISAVLILSTQAIAEPQYALSCSLLGSMAKVYAYNSGDSAEGENQYVIVTACDNQRQCQRSVKLMYIYATPNNFREIGAVRFGGSKSFCSAFVRQ